MTRILARLLGLTRGEYARLELEATRRAMTIRELLDPHETTKTILEWAKNQAREASS